MTTIHGTIRCPVCGREFAWHARFAGCQARCACGRVITYPAHPESITDSIETSPSASLHGRDEYDLAPLRPPKPAHADPVQALPVEALPAQVLGYKSAKRDLADKPELDVEKLTKQTLPLWLLTGGLLIEMVMTFLRAKWWWADPNTAYLHFLIDVGFSTLVMTAGVLIAARLRQIPIGSFPSAVLRLAALIVASDAVSDMLAPVAMFIPFGGLVLLLVDFALYFALLGTLFDLDESDTWYCICIIFLLRLSLYFGIGLFWK